MNLKTLFLILGLATFTTSKIQSADASSYGMLKDQAFIQVPGSPPALSGQQPYSILLFVNVSDTGEVDNASVRLPSGNSVNLPLDFNAADGLRYAFTDSAATSAALDAKYPAGSYAFTITGAADGVKTATVALGSNNYPAAAPSIANLAAAQTVDVNSDFAVNWLPFAGGTANDRIRLTLEDSNGLRIFSTPDWIQPDALPGTATTAQIPAGTLTDGETYQARLTFAKFGPVDSTTYAGAAGLSGFSAETSFSLKAGTAATGTPDPTPPTLVSTSPQSGGTGVATQAPLLFMFSEPMAPLQSIAWSSNIATDKFLYFWSGDKKSLTAFYSGGFPAGAKITWSLNPTPNFASNFQDLAGNQLPSGVYNGTFTTAGGTNSTGGGTNSTTYCQTGATNDSGLGSFSIFKVVNYLQTNAAPPVLDPQSGALFSALMTPHINQTYTSASLTLPGGSTRSLTNFFGSTYFFFQSFGSQAELDAAFPSGNYVLRAQTSASSQVSATLPFPANAYPPVPQILNLPDLQAMNPNADFTLRWNPFTGASQFDNITLEIHDSSQDTIFFAPDYCLPRLLTNTATAIVIPAGTFKTSGQFEGTLRFNRFAGGDTNSIAGSSGSAGVSANTQFTFQVGSTNQTTAPKWMDIHRNSDGSVTLQLSGSANKTYIVQASANLTQWSTVLTTNSVSGSVTYRDGGAATTSFRYFRAQMQ